MASDTDMKISIGERQKRNFYRNCAIGLALFIVFMSLPSLCAGHGHDHDHDHHHHHAEPASFKWSREANELYEEELHHHDHGHDHVHHHEHDHIHSHEHVHEHAHEHVHSHESATKQVQGNLGFSKRNLMYRNQTCFFSFRTI